MNGRCCDYCPEPAVGQHGDKFHCRCRAHEERAKRDWRDCCAVYERRKDFARFEKLQQDNKHNRGER